MIKMIIQFYLGIDFILWVILAMMMNIDSDLEYINIVFFTLTRLSVNWSAIIPDHFLKKYPPKYR